MTLRPLGLTILADVSAGMFGACLFMLFIFLSLSRGHDETQPDRAAHAPGIAIASREVLSPEATIRLLHAHGGSVPGIGIDLFDDRLVIVDGSGRIVLRDPIASRLTKAVARLNASPVRLYVLSHTHYETVRAALALRGLAHSEVNVPAALRDPSAPDRRWAAAFLELGEAGFSLPAFTEELARLLDASARRGSPGAGTYHGHADSKSLARRLADRLVSFATIVLPFCGFMCVLWIEFRRR